MGTSSADNGRPALTALAAGAALGLIAAAAGAVVQRLRRNPVLVRAGRFRPDHGSGPDPEAVTARKEADMPGWKQGMPGSFDAGTLEISSLDAATGTPGRTWIVHNGPEWQGLPGERVVLPWERGRGPGRPSM
ncbi:hypothetical protein FYJ28_11215 [Arthrobacter sp. BL-252-APC-1A]|uniref:hypothetical protein n=1 Tax=Arthrobacter sp. BL-252-APC-1A TaxID=2606622 RepID=UPI0012B34248|nr:hypothetical protein [Arthrobacter sp. BL-252-APC-1A]MSR99389.1 hypothetical protein [Arthrobacter sp. BL-252-APC-1A]